MGFKFLQTRLPGVIVIEPDCFGDERGFFLESYKKSVFDENGVVGPFLQDNHSCSSKGVLRGLHFQASPMEQAKLIRVIRGKIWDVAVDIRKNSPNFLKWFAVELSEENKKMFYIPAGFAHGFLSLEDNTHLVYKCTTEYAPAYDRSVKWNDPAINIKWPLELVGTPIISTKDLSAKNSNEMELL